MVNGQSSESIEQEAALLDTVTAELEAVDAALARLDDGSYGLCEVCAAPLSSEALHSQPLATRCAAHTVHAV